MKRIGIIAIAVCILTIGIQATINLTPKEDYAMVHVVERAARAYIRITRSDGKSELKNIKLDSFEEESYLPNIDPIAQTLKELNNEGYILQSSNIGAFSVGRKGKDGDILQSYTLVKR